VFIEEMNFISSHNISLINGVCVPGVLKLSTKESYNYSKHPSTLVSNC